MIINGSMPEDWRSSSSADRQLTGSRKGPTQPAADVDELLLRADALFRANQAQDLRGLIAEKIEGLRNYNVPAMQTVIAILMWGRSGSLLLASYLDGHDDVIMLPVSRGQRLYEFFEQFQSLSLREKLLAYPAFQPNYPQLFEGDFSISSAQYYAAVQAIVEFYGSWPAEFLESRRAFFVFMHIAYCLALGRRPASPSPKIAYAQHVRDDLAARKLVKDFPHSRFVHTIRDPISSCDGIFHYHLSVLSEHHMLLPYSSLDMLANKDRPHLGMEDRTQTIRFEDLHSDISGVMRDLANWLGLSYRPSLLKSTFNGIPYVNTRDGVSWSGPRLEQVQRRSRHLSRKDRALLFAFFYENFSVWKYPCPKILRYRIIRCIVFLSLVFFPMRMELTAAREIFGRRVLPALRRRDVRRAVKSLVVIGFCRLRITRLLFTTFFRRCMFRPVLLHPTHTKKELEFPGSGATNSEPTGKNA